jgi:hypothetical protein
MVTNVRPHSRPIFHDAPADDGRLSSACDICGGESPAHGEVRAAYRVVPELVAACGRAKVWLHADRGLTCCLVLHRRAGAGYFRVGIAVRRSGAQIEAGAEAERPAHAPDTGSERLAIVLAGEGPLVDVVVEGPPFGAVVL